MAKSCLDLFYFGPGVFLSLDYALIDTFTGIPIFNTKIFMDTKPS